MAYGGGESQKGVGSGSPPFAWAVPIASHGKGVPGLCPPANQLISIAHWNLKYGTETKSFNCSLGKLGSLPYLYPVQGRRKTQ